MGSLNPRNLGEDLSGEQKVEQAVREMFHLRPTPPGIGETEFATGFSRVDDNVRFVYRSGFDTIGSALVEAFQKVTHTSHGYPKWDDLQLLEMLLTGRSPAEYRAWARSDTASFAELVADCDRLEQTLPVLLASASPPLETVFHFLRELHPSLEDFQQYRTTGMSATLNQGRGILFRALGLMKYDAVITDTLFELAQSLDREGGFVGTYLVSALVNQEMQAESQPRSRALLARLEQQPQHSIYRGILESGLSKNEI